MRFGKMEPIRPAATWSLRNGEHEIRLRISPLPMAWMAKLAEELPEPAAPMKVIGQGQNGSIRERDETDPDYQRRKARHTRASNAQFLALILRNEPEVVWPDRKANEDPVDYWNRAHDELDAFGLNTAHYQELEEIVEGISTVTKATVERAQLGFTEAESDGSPPPSRSASSTPMDGRVTSSDQPLMMTS